MQTLGADRLYALEHEDEPFHDGYFTSWAKKPSASHPFHFRDGVTFVLTDTDLQPDDDPSVAAQEPDGDVEEAADHADG